MIIDIIFIIGFALVFWGIGYTAYIDWKMGACQSYIHEDGTVREWDRFGNHATVYPNGETKIYIEEPEKGLGPVYKNWHDSR